MNPVTGEKIIDIEGRKYVLRFTWRVLSEIEQKYGDKPNLFDPEIIAFVGAAGLRARHPEITAEWILDTSPPLVPFAGAVQEALQWAYFGPDKPPSSGDVKKNRPTVGWLRHIAQRLGRGFRP